jgi:serine/threonine protein kinase
MTEPSLPEETIFDQAREITSDVERASFLDRACGNKRALRAEIEALLRADERTGDLLDLPDRPASLPDPFGAEGPGAVIGPYTLVERIGEGGMGIVWMAEQMRPVKRMVALKILKLGMDSRGVIAHFETERQALALMDHPHIARILDAGTTDGGRPYFVMDLVHGVPITTYCDEHKLTTRARLRLFFAVCHAVQHAHQKGIIHRDLKPSNVLVAPCDDEPVPKVIDFGVAKASGPRIIDRTVFTQLGQLVGTLEYMSPEQAAFAPDIDTRSDIYSLGVLLYELLTGSTPFETQRLRAAAFDEGLRIIREEEPPRPSKRLLQIGRSRTTWRRQNGVGSLGPNGAKHILPESGLDEIAANRQTEPTRLGRLLHGDLDWIVMKCLEKDRGRRYATANGLAMDVQHYLNDEPVAACPPSLRYRLWKFVRRNKGSVLAASILALALVVGIIGTTWGLVRATDQLFLALLNQARAGRFSRQSGQRLESLDALTRAARIHPDERLRDEAIAAMALPDIRRVPGWHSSPPDAEGVAYSARYRLYARVDSTGMISIRTIPDDQEIQRIASGPIIGRCLEFSPDDQFLVALSTEYRLRLWRVADGKPVLRDDLQGCRAYAFSPDGRRMAVGQAHSVLCFDLTTLQEIRRWLLPAPAHGLAFHPDNRRLAVGPFNWSVVFVYDSASGARVTELPVGAMAEPFVAWHPDGEQLAVTAPDGRIHIWNVSAKRQFATLAGHAQAVTTLAFHPEGGLLASHSWDGVLRLWDPATGRPLLQLPFTADGNPRYSRDARWLGVTWHGEQADLLEVTPSREYRTLVSSAGASSGAFARGDISPDGRLLVVGMAGAQFWDLRTGREVAKLPAVTPYVAFDGPSRRDGATVPPQSQPWSLLTGGAEGLWRWPVSRDDSPGRGLRLGPPRRLSHLRRAWFGRSPDGRTLGVVTKESGSNQILDLETGAVRRELGVHPNGEVRALSGDGRWAASSGHHSDRVRLWNAGTGQMVQEWTVGKQTDVFFTPDSRALIIARGDGFRFWDVETLQPIRQLRRDVAQFPVSVAFSPDGRLMALEMAPAVIHLKEAATGRTVARLEDPHGDRATWLGFTPDGTQLVVVVRYASAIHVWNLRAIRARLKTMSLDWDWPEFPPAADEGPAAEPQAIEVVPDELGTTPVTAEQRSQRAIALYRKDLEANPNSGHACNSVAWSYLTAPGALRNVEAALPLAEKAVRLTGGDPNSRNTLGLAYCRAGRYRDAVEVLRPNLEHQKDWALAHDLYFLAMSYHGLGETARARDYYQWAVRWAQRQPDLDPTHVEELTAFRAEAAKLLGIDQTNEQPRGASFSGAGPGGLRVGVRPLTANPSPQRSAIFEGRFI